MNNTEFQTRKENLQLCKDRALRILEDGGTTIEAWTSFLSDMNKDEDLRNHIGLQLGGQLFASGHLSNSKALRNHIEGCN